MGRDLTEKQYREALAKRGCRPGLFGYVEYGHHWIPAANAGNRRRDRLAYVIGEIDRIEARRAA